MQGIQSTAWSSHSCSSQFAQHFESLLSVLMGAASGCSWKWLNPTLGGWSSWGAAESALSQLLAEQTHSIHSISAHTCLQWCEGGAGVASAPHRAGSCHRLVLKPFACWSPGLGWHIKGGYSWSVWGCRAPGASPGDPHTEWGTGLPGEGAAGGQCCHWVGSGQAEEMNWQESYRNLQQKHAQGFSSGMEQPYVKWWAGDEMPGRQWYRKGSEEPSELHFAGEPAGSPYSKETRLFPSAAWAKA